jgi:3-methylfumaryl-CoA hydratase
MSPAGPGAVGDELPGLTVQPGNVQLFCYSAVTWNPHRIHYDAPYTTEVEGHPGLVVQGPLIGSWLLEVAQRWVDSWGVVQGSSYRNVASAYAGERLVVGGEVVDAGAEPSARIRVTKDDGTVVCEGSVTARRAETA